jgi:hypothetical protein
MCGHLAHPIAPDDERRHRPDADQPYGPVHKSGAGKKRKDERGNSAPHQNRSGEGNVVIADGLWDEYGADCDPRCGRERRQDGSDYAE